MEDPAPAFACTPALAIEGHLDSTRSKHIKIYRSGIKQVSDTFFDCEAVSVVERRPGQGRRDGMVGGDPKGNPQRRVRLMRDKRTSWATIMGRSRWSK